MRLWFPSLLLLATGLSSPLAAQEPASAPSWPQWRGPDRTGKIEAAPWPDTLSEGSLQQAWKMPLAPSYSGPIVAGDLVIVTETVDRKNEVVRALDRTTGEERWKREWAGAMSVPFFAKANGDWIRSTPSYADGLIYIAGMRDVLVCLNAADGSEAWRFDFPAKLESKLPDFGFVCSPLVDGDYVYVQAGGGFAKLDRRSGELVWISLQDGGGMMGSAFSSPVKATLCGVPQLIVQTRETLCGVDEKDGTKLWEQKVPAFRGMNILTPTVIGDQIFTSTYQNKSFLYQVSNNGQWKVEEKWNNAKRGYMSSPVVIDGHVYLHLQNQRFTCLDWESGEDRWTSEPFGKYWSLIANGDRILALDERGELLLLQADPQEFKLIDQRKVAESESWAHLAICGEWIYIRELDAITAYRWTAPMQ